MAGGVPRDPGPPGHSPLCRGPTRMSATKLTCPKCQATLRPAKPLPAGKRVKCPKCGARFAVGAGGAAGRPAAKKKPAPARKITFDDENEGSAITYGVV